MLDRVETDDTIREAGRWHAGLSARRAHEEGGDPDKATFLRRVEDGTIPRPLRIGVMSRRPTSEFVAVIEEAKAQRAA